MSLPPQHGFKDPNAQLLASVVPPPPPTLRDRAVQYVSELRAPSMRSILRWSRSREARDCCIAAVVGAGLMIAFYRSESSSNASTAKPTVAARPSSAPVTERAHILPAPATLASRAPSAAATSAAVSPVREADAVEAATRSASESRESDAAEAPKNAVTRASKQRRVEKKSKKKLARNKQKAKRGYAARSAARTARHAKNQRVTTPGPLGAWLATRSRSDESSAAKRR